MKMQDESFEARAMPLIVVLVSALLLFWAWLGAFVVLNPNLFDPAIRAAGLMILLLFGGMFLASLVTLFNYRIRVSNDEITILLPYGGEITYGRDEMNLFTKGRIMKLRTVPRVKLGWRRLFTIDRLEYNYVIIKRKELVDTRCE
jgi:hypothetical protein